MASIYFHGIFYFYPRSPCGERRFSPRNRNKAVVDFYPRSPCGERPATRAAPQRAPKFLSTLSLRRATIAAVCFKSSFPISIHALLAESDFRPYRECASERLFLSTLSLRRATMTTGYSVELCNDFYPRSPCGERRGGRIRPLRRSRISIHALLAESDKSPVDVMIPANDFYPRSPCGERPQDAMSNRLSNVFLSTLSLRRATSRSRTFKVP